MQELLILSSVWKSCVFPSSLSNLRIVEFKSLCASNNSGDLDVTV